MMADQSSLIPGVELPTVIVDQILYRSIKNLIMGKTYQATLLPPQLPTPASLPFYHPFCIIDFLIFDVDALLLYTSSAMRSICNTPERCKMTSRRQGSCILT